MIISLIFLPLQFYMPVKFFYHIIERRKWIPTLDLGGKSKVMLTLHFSSEWRVFRHPWMGGPCTQPRKGWGGSTMKMLSMRMCWPEFGSSAPKYTSRLWRHMPIMTPSSRLGCFTNIFPPAFSSTPVPGWLHGTQDTHWWCFSPTQTLTYILSSSQTYIKMRLCQLSRYP